MLTYTVLFVSLLLKEKIRFFFFSADTNKTLGDKYGKSKVREQAEKMNQDPCNVQFGGVIWGSETCETEEDV